MIRPGDSASLRKERGAFFTPPEIADYLADWAAGGDPAARILDPTCGEAAFLLSAGRRLRALGRDGSSMDDQLFGVDLHKSSLDWATSLLEAEGLDAHLLAGDFFDVPTPDQMDAPLPLMDAVIGNPPSSDTRTTSAKPEPSPARQLSDSMCGCPAWRPRGQLCWCMPAAS